MTAQCIETRFELQTRGPAYVPARRVFRLLRTSAGSFGTNVTLQMLPVLCKWYNPLNSRANWAESI